MSLLKPTPGEVIDRISILRLKTEAYRKAARDTKSLEAETVELCRYLDRFMKPPDSPTPLSNELATVNTLLWQAEDDVRSDSPEIAAIAREIARLNDERTRLIREINRLYGTETIEEKIYT